MASTSDYIKSMYLDPKNDNDQYLILKKKKKRKTISDVRNVNIYDDDINLNEIKTTEDDEKYALKEERPAIDENVKDNSRLIKKLSSWEQIEIKSSKKNRSKNSESDDDYDLSNLRNKKNNNDSDEDLNIRRKRDSSSSDLEIDRRRKKVSESDSDLDIRNRRRKKISESDSDLDIRNRRKESPENRSRERRREYSNRERHEPIINESRQHKRYNLDKEESRKKSDNDYYRDKSRRRSKDKSPKVSKTNEIRKRDNLNEDYNKDYNKDRRIKKNRHSIDNETDKHNHHHKRRKNRQSIESNDNNHHRKSKRKSEDDSPKVIKINEIKNSSDEEDIREKIKNLYKEDGPNLEKLKEKNEIDHKYKQWSKGMKQIDDRRKQLEEEEYEMSKPLARYKDDEDLDRHLRDQELIDDPMLEYFRKRKKEQDQQKQLEETGEVWIIPKYESKLPPPINRYNILPGYRWDGVDRGNGFEMKLLSKKAEKLANQEEAYKYSTSDM